MSCKGEIGVPAAFSKNTTTKSIFRRATKTKFGSVYKKITLIIDFKIYDKQRESFVINFDSPHDATTDNGKCNITSFIRND